MKRLTLILMLFLSFIFVGCDTRSLSDIIKENDELLEEIERKCIDTLGEERHREIWGEDEESKTPNIELTVTAGTEDDLFEFKVILENNSGRSIYVCSSDFTLRMPGRLTINPTLSSVNSFEAIELNDGEKMQGYVYFESEEIKNPGIYYLNFNHHLSSQEFPFRKK